MQSASLLFAGGLQLAAWRHASYAAAATLQFVYARGFQAQPTLGATPSAAWRALLFVLRQFYVSPAGDRPNEFAT